MLNIGLGLASQFLVKRQPVELIKKDSSGPTSLLDYSDDISIHYEHNIINSNTFSYYHVHHEFRILLQHS